MLAELSDQYDELISYAQLYDSATFEAKKMIVNQLIQRVDVSRNYQISVKSTFSWVSFWMIPPRKKETKTY